MSAFVGLGQIFAIAGSPATPVEEITSVEYSGGKTDLHDSSHSGSTRHTYLNGLPDSGEVTVKANWVPGATGQEAIRAAQGTVLSFTHTLPESLGSNDFDAVVESVDYTSDMDKTAELTIKLKVSGEVSFS